LYVELPRKIPLNCDLTRSDTLKMTHVMLRHFLFPRVGASGMHIRSKENESVQVTSFFKQCIIEVPDRTV
jgi:hypothetical protein